MRTEDDIATLNHMHRVCLRVMPNTAATAMAAAWVIVWFEHKFKDPHNQVSLINLLDDLWDGKMNVCGIERGQPVFITTDAT